LVQDPVGLALIVPPQRVMMTTASLEDRGVTAREADVPVLALACQPFEMLPAPEYWRPRAIVLPPVVVIVTVVAAPVTI
jgi:hypothetical protein